MTEEVSREKPSSARIYDYLLGGYHNFEADRAAARQFTEILPNAPLIMRANRAFLRRAVRFMAEQGVEQFLDIGSGIPTVGNVHEVAQAVNPEARVVYVDMDPVAVRQSEAILEDNPNATIVQADARHIDAILEHPETRRLLDFEKPVAVLIVSVLLFVPEDEEVHGIVRRLREVLAPGSYLGISHGTEEGVPQEQVEQSIKLYAATGNPIKLRSHEEIEEFFAGFEMVEPGVTRLPLWRPEGPEDLMVDQPEISGNYGGVGRKPGDGA